MAAPLLAPLAALPGAVAVSALVYHPLPAWFFFPSFLLWFRRVFYCCVAPRHCPTVPLCPLIMLQQESTSQFFVLFFCVLFVCCLCVGRAGDVLAGQTPFGGVGAVRSLNLHEFQSKDLMEEFGVVVQKGKAATTAEEAEEVSKWIKSESELCVSVPLALLVSAGLSVYASVCLSPCCFTLPQTRTRS